MDAATIREELDHPVIDADGHIIEFIPAIRDPSLPTLALHSLTRSRP